jgi:hypothetical protein
MATPNTAQIAIVSNEVSPITDIENILLARDNLWAFARQSRWILQAQEGCVKKICCKA